VGKWGEVESWDAWEGMSYQVTMILALLGTDWSACGARAGGKHPGGNAPPSDPATPALPGSAPRYNSEAACPRRINAIANRVPRKRSIIAKPNVSVATRCCKNNMITAMPKTAFSIIAVIIIGR
jgi:hypothetical protein